MVSPDIKASVIEELGNRDILPDNKYVSGVIANNPGLYNHVASVANTDDGSLTDSPAAVTSDINYWRNKVRKLPVSEAAVGRAVENGIEKVITPGEEQNKPGHRNLTDMLKRLGIRPLECADDMIMSLA